MNKSILAISAGTITLLALSSCSSLHHTASTATVDSEIYTRTVAELDVTPSRVSKTTEWKWNPFNSVSVINEKKTATAELLKEANADVLVEPDYQVKRRGIFRGGSLTVSGFPAKYTGFRPMTKEDAEVINLANGGTGSTRLSTVQTTADPKPVSQSSIDKSLRKNKIKYDNHQFIDIIAGGVFPYDTDGCGYAAGLMWGKTWNRWGMYIKGLFESSTSTFNADEFESNGCKQKKVKTGGQITIGAIKTLSQSWNMYAGIGYGSVPGYSSSRFYHGETVLIAKLYDAIPVDLGFQWHINGINITAGINVERLIDGPGSEININPFIGIGYSF